MAEKHKTASFEPGSSATDDIVRSFLGKHSIDEGDVSGYRITRKIGEYPTIELTMYFDDRPTTEADIAPEMCGNCPGRSGNGNLCNYPLCKEY